MSFSAGAWLLHPASLAAEVDSASGFTLEHGVGGAAVRANRGRSDPMGEDETRTSIIWGSRHPRQLARTAPDLSGQVTVVDGGS